VELRVCLLGTELFAIELNRRSLTEAALEQVEEESAVATDRLHDFGFVRTETEDD
jgi:hypothetical protein